MNMRATCFHKSLQKSAHDSILILIDLGKSGAVWCFLVILLGALGTKGHPGNPGEDNSEEAAGMVVRVLAPRSPW